MNPPPLENNPTEQQSESIKTLPSAIEALLREPVSLLKTLRDNSQLAFLLGLTGLACAAIFGFVVGTFSGHEQLWSAPLKISVGLLLAALICFPSLYIFSCLANSPLRLTGLMGAYLSYLCLIGVLLIAFAPILWIFTQSSGSIPFVGGLSLIVWSLVFLMAANLLRKLTKSDSQSPWQLTLWIVMFFVVTLQMSTALRPILGRGESFLPQEKKFFLTHWGESFDHSFSRSSYPLDSEKNEGRNHNQRLDSRSTE